MYEIKNSFILLSIYQNPLLKIKCWLIYVPDQYIATSFLANIYLSPVSFSVLWQNVTFRPSNCFCQPFLIVVHEQTQ